MHDRAVHLGRESHICTRAPNLEHLSCPDVIDCYTTAKASHYCEAEILHVALLESEIDDQRTTKGPNRPRKYNRRKGRTGHVSTTEEGRTGHVSTTGRKAEQAT